MKSFKKVVLSSLLLSVTALSLSVPSVTYASESLGNQPENSMESGITSILTDSDVSVANAYVHFDESLNSFIVDDSIYNALSLDTINQVINQVSQTNIQLQNAKSDKSVTTFAVDPAGNQTTVSMSLSRGAGTTSVTYYWNYARVRLSLNSIKNMGTVMSVGGLLIPHPIVSKACSLLGIGIGRVTSGIWFDYNYAIGVLCGNMGWQ
ncbi:hypothetical protein RAK27_18520 [Carnobacterium maltaromaticum]|uniref:Uncharacterized protein n=1 Tax=Carnobacterium maltaromaticum TaxID=2751 RepID=A0AAW9K1B5_CARML|nr:hypothetical protein [Carnobacterium maltaromaticum]MDZ5760639.1 hypothetical protein [Carnobacterium maltaromaticum]